MPVHWLPIAYIFNWGLYVKKIFVCASIFVTYSLNCKWIHNLPTERAIVCEDAIHNSYAFVYIILLLTINFLTLLLFAKTGLIFTSLKILSNLCFLHNAMRSFSNKRLISFLKGNKEPGIIKFSLSKVSSAWKRDKKQR